jgi:hypothetical protein
MKVVSLMDRPRGCANSAQNETSWSLVWLVLLARLWPGYNVALTQHCKVYLYPIARSFQQHQRHITILSTWIEW